MDLSLSAIGSSLIFSCIGFYVFRYGRRCNRISLILSGIALMTFSYFTSGPLFDWGVGIILSGGAYYVYSSDSILW